MYNRYELYIQNTNYIYTEIRYNRSKPTVAVGSCAHGPFRAPAGVSNIAFCVCRIIYMDSATVAYVSTAA